MRVEITRNVMINGEPVKAGSFVEVDRVLGTLLLNSDKAKVAKEQTPPSASKPKAASTPKVDFKATLKPKAAPAPKTAPAPKPKTASTSKPADAQPTLSENPAIPSGDD